MPPTLPRTESAFHQNLTKEDREELLQLQTLRQIPKSRYATQSCITGIPSGRGRKIVYSHIEVYKMVETIATDLREAGVRPQTVCAFVLNNCIEAIVYFQALQWIGAIALPIDPKLSAEDITVILKECQASTVVSPLVDEDDQEEDELFQKLKTACSSIEIIEWYVSRSTNQGVFLERQGIRAGEGAAWSGGAADFKIDPSESSVRIAVADGDSWLTFDISHRRITSATREFANTYELTADISTLLFFPFHSINGLMCMLATMYSGGNLVLPEGANIDANQLLKHITDHKVRWFAADPDTILALYDELTNNPGEKDSLQLAFIRSLGGNIAADTMRTIEPVLRAPVLEAYGPPETCGLVAANKDFDFRPGTCGKAVGGCEILILDPSGEKLASGSVGNIAVYGPFTLRDYINSEYANEHSFVDIHEDDTTKRFFLTGDQGLLSTDGFLKITSFRTSRRSAPDPVEDEEKSNSKDVVGSMTFDDDDAEELKREREEELRQLEEEREQEELRLEEERKKEEELLRAEEERKKEEEQRQLEEEREKEELRQQEEEQKEEELKGDEERNAAAVVVSKEGKTSSSSDSTAENEVDSDEEETASEQKSNTTMTRSGTAVSRRTVEDELRKEMLDQIMERLDRIESNQKRLEEEIEAAHRREMEKLREMFENSDLSKPLPPPPPPVVNVDMDAINSAVSAAAAAAARSSKDAAEAVKTAKDAAESAAKAVEASESRPAELPAHVVQVVDPESIQKTVLVSLEEVEEAMKLHPAVAMARAFGRPDKKYGTEVFCAINPKKGARVSEPWLKLHAQSVLPAAFVPKKFFYKEDLKGHEERETLAEDKELKRMSYYAGYSGSKVVNAPSWNPPQSQAKGATSSN